MINLDKKEEKIVSEILKNKQKLNILLLFFDGFWNQSNKVTLTKFFL